MFRQIVVPTEKDHSVELPKEFYGQRVEIIAFPVPSEKSLLSKTEINANAFYDSINLDLSRYVFNRDEANER